MQRLIYPDYYWFVYVLRKRDGRVITNSAHIIAELAISTEIFFIQTQSPKRTIWVGAIQFSFYVFG